MNRTVTSEDRDLLARAREAMARAYAPYSKFKVGAAVRGASGKIYQGCNVENASFSLSICAERVAIAQCVLEGDYTFLAIAIVAEGGALPVPCGACCQVMAEFQGNPRIIVANTFTVQVFTLVDFLPKPFQLAKG